MVLLAFQLNAEIKGCMACVDFADCVSQDRIEAEVLSEGVLIFAHGDHRVLQQILHILVDAEECQLLIRIEDNDGSCQQKRLMILRILIVERQIIHETHLSHGLIEAVRIFICNVADKRTADQILERDRSAEEKAL